MRVVIVAGSLRQDSLNRRFGHHLASRLRQEGHEVSCFDGEDLRLPLFEEGTATPEPVARLQAAMAASHGMVLVSPEYNAGISGHLKNLSDWLSVLSPSPWKNLPVLLCACSPGAFGGARGLMSWRPTLANMGAIALPQVLTVPAADSSLDDQGEPKDPRTQKALAEALEAFLGFSERLRG